MRATFGRSACAAALAVALGCSAGTAAAQSQLDAAVSALRRDPVYVDPSAERKLSESEQERVRQAIRSAGEPMFVAVLPGEAADAAGGDVGELPRVLGQAVGLTGTYAVVAGNSFRASSNALDSGVAGELATAAFQSKRDDGTVAVLLEFIGRVADESRGSGRGGGGDGNEQSRDDSGSGVLGILAVAGLGLGGFLFVRGRRRARDRAKDMADEVEVLRADVSVLADDVLSLEPQIAMHEEARADYDAAVSRYRWAEAALSSVDSDGDVDRMRRVLAEAHYAMARARARIDGRTPPPPPDELSAEGRRGEPAVVLDDRDEPVYAGRRAGGGWYGGGGWFDGGGLLTGLVLGQVLGGIGGHDHDHDEEPTGSIFGGGASGGGDWGGGDSGGGDWGGGGDSGGGDW